MFILKSICNILVVVQTLACYFFRFQSKDLFFLLLNYLGKKTRHVKSLKATITDSCYLIYVL